MLVYLTFHISGSSTTLHKDIRFGVNRFKREQITGAYDGHCITLSRPMTWLSNGRSFVVKKLKLHWSPLVENTYTAFIECGLDDFTIVHTQRAVEKTPGVHYLLLNLHSKTNDALEVSLGSSRSLFDDYSSLKECHMQLSGSRTGNFWRCAIGDVDTPFDDPSKDLLFEGAYWKEDELEGMLNYFTFPGNSLRDDTLMYCFFDRIAIDSITNSTLNLEFYARGAYIYRVELNSISQGEIKEFKFRVILPESDYDTDTGLEFESDSESDSEILTESVQSVRFALSPTADTPSGTSAPNNTPQRGIRLRFGSPTPVQPTIDSFDGDISSIDLPSPPRLERQQNSILTTSPRVNPDSDSADEEFSFSLDVSNIFPDVED